MQAIINLPIKIPFTSAGLVTGLTSFSPIFLLNGVIMTTPTWTSTEIGSGLYTLNFIPTSTGILSILISQSLLVPIEVVSVTTAQILQNLADESIGSWTWNKTTGILNMIRQDGTPLANFNVVDTLSTASRERF
jgi:hypothetical protein